MTKSMQTEELPPDLLITVCDACLQASCWQAKFFCDKAQSAGTIDVTVRRLRELNLEHPSYWLNDPRAKEYLVHGRRKPEMSEKPKVVCLCGSTRFKDAFDEANYRETMAGRIVLSVGFFMHATGNKHGETIGATAEQKIALDELHKRKIDLADEVFVLNVGGYIGESTRSEIDYASVNGKPVRYLESP